MGQDYRSLNYSKGSIFNPAFLHEKAGLLLNNARLLLINQQRDNCNKEITLISTNHLSYGKGLGQCNSWPYIPLQLSQYPWGGIDMTRG